MPPYIKHWLTTALVSCGLGAQAEVITAQPYDLHLSAYATLTFNGPMLDAFGIINPSITPVGWATNPITIQQDQDGYYTNVQTSTPIKSLSFDEQNIVGFSTTGGLSLTVPQKRAVSTSGGSITVTDLDVDLQGRMIYGTVIGGNGVGTIEHAALWTYSSVTGGTAPSQFSVNSLWFTPTGFQTFTRSLGLYSVGWSALAGVTDYGTISVIINAPLEMGSPPPWYVGELPEPSTYALMGMGLAGLMVAKRRRQAR